MQPGPQGFEMKRKCFGVLLLVVCWATIFSSAVAEELILAFPTCSDTPSLCKTESERKASQNRLDEERRQREARQKAAEAEIARKEAEVKEFTDKFGAHRESEARKLQQMRDAARLAANPSLPGRQLPQAAKQCKAVPVRFDAASSWKDSKQEAESDAQRLAGIRCAGTNRGISAVSVSCSSQVKEYATVTKQGQVIKEPLKAPIWLCVAQGACNATKEICEGGEQSSGASRQ